MYYLLCGIESVLHNPTDACNLVSSHKEKSITRRWVQPTLFCPPSTQSFMQPNSIFGIFLNLFIVWIIRLTNCLHDFYCVSSRNVPWWPCVMGGWALCCVLMLICCHQSWPRSAQAETRDGEWSRENWKPRVDNWSEHTDNSVTSVTLPSLTPHWTLSPGSPINNSRHISVDL